MWIIINGANNGKCVSTLEAKSHLQKVLSVGYEI